MTPELQKEYGVIEPASSVFARRWDRRPDFLPDEAVDLDYIGEDDQGIWLRLHPETLVVQDKQLQAVFGAWRFTHERKLTLTEQRTSSNWFLTAWAALASAANRQMEKELERDDG
jgi:hypothetical protein